MSVPDLPHRDPYAQYQCRQLDRVQVKPSALRSLRNLRGEAVKHGRKLYVVFSGASGKLRTPARPPVWQSAGRAIRTQTSRD